MNQTTFSELGLSSNILQAVQDMGFQTPSDIQEKAIPVLLNETEKDFIGQAQTGTGKTAAFVIPLLEKLDMNLKLPQAIILAPTRELASQVENEIKNLSKYMKIKTLSIYGGVSYEKQIMGLKRNPQIVVGTPGRVIDLINRGNLKLEDAHTCILDEADEMLNMGFLEDVKIILSKLGEQRQLIMFSATMPKSIKDLVKENFREYNFVQIQKKTLSNEDIDQKYFVVKNKYQKEALVRLIEMNDNFYGIVFCKTKIETVEVGEDLKERGYKVEILNGDMGQAQRDMAMNNFKSGKSNILVCTDVAARGIDVNNLTHVVNYGLPQDNESYVHRIGRTGRAGMKGEAYTIATASTRFIIPKIEKTTKQKITFAKLPDVFVLKNKLISKEMETAAKLKSTIVERGEEFKVDESFEVFKELCKDLKKEDILKLMFTWKFNKELRRLDNLPEIEVDASESSDMPRERSRRGRNSRAGGGDRGRSERRRSDRGDRFERGNSERRASRSSSEGSGERRSAKSSEGSRDRKRSDRPRTERSRSDRPRARGTR